MKERGMIFNAEMVRALLDGRKTQTRRLISPQPIGFADGLPSAQVNDSWQPGFVGIKCPRGMPGDRIWVRETFIQGWDCGDDGLPDCCDADGNELPIKTWYRADGHIDWADDWGGIRESTPWSPSIHMPRSASRITLEITDVRVERVQDISVADAIAEGVRASGVTAPITDGPIQHFQRVWRDIYGDSAWCENPWVWVIEFKRVVS